MHDKKYLMKAFDTAKTAQSNARAPFSGFKVGAVLIDNKGDFHVGSNVELIINGISVCAERSAISAMVTAGVSEFNDAVIVTDTPHGAAPCGVCRQALSEFSKAGLSSKIHVANLNGIIKTYELKDLFPHAFDNSFLP